MGTFRELTANNLPILAKEIAKRVAAYQHGSPTMIIGPRTPGARVLNEFCRDALGREWACTGAGTPGTWMQIRPAPVTADPSSGTIPTGYLILNVNHRQVKRRGGALPPAGFHRRCLPGGLPPALSGDFLCSISRRMEKLHINTDAGSIELTPATLDDLKPVAARWPMGVVFSQVEAEPHGLVFQVGEQEAYGIKFQPPDTDEQTAKGLYFNNLALIASALPLYLEHQHLGIMLPCAYCKQKPDSRFESGLALFVGADPSSRLPSQSRADALDDDQLGDGASRMAFDMAAAVLKAGKQVGLPVNTVIGVDVRPRLELGVLGMPFLVQGAKVFVIQHPLRHDHPVWAFAVRAGFSKLPYAPMIPAAVPGPPNVPHAWRDRVKILSQRLRGTSLGQT